MTKGKMASGLDMYLASQAGKKQVTAAVKRAVKPRRRIKRRRKVGRPAPSSLNPGKAAPNRAQAMMVSHRAPSYAQDLAQYRLALTDPFDPDAIGCRVADSWQTPTSTYHIRQAITITTNASGTASFAVLPSPCYTFLAHDPAFTGPTVTGLYSFAQNPLNTATKAGAGYLTSPTALAYHMTEYRVVSWGLRFVAKDTAVSTKGKVYIAAVPTTENCPSWNTLDTITGTPNSLGEYTLGMATSGFHDIVNLPGVRTFSMQDLLRGEVAATGVPTNSIYYSFKGTSDRSNQAWNAAGDQYLADEIVYDSLTKGLVNATAGGRKDIASLRGGRAFIIHATGMPANTNEFDIELVFHIEGLPNITGTLVPSAMRPVVGNTSIVERAISFASEAHRIITYIKDAVGAVSGTRALAFLGL